MGELHYGAPHDLRTAVDAVLAARSPRSTTLRAALDVGCGTGLAGAAFRSLVSGALVGVDLSAQMAARAEARVGVYARVVVGDLDVEVPAAAAAQTAAAGHAFDLVLFADVLIYFGDLRGPLQHAAAALEPGGLLALTLERPTDAAALAGRDWKWKLEGSGRLVRSDHSLAHGLVVRGRASWMYSAEAYMAPFRFVFAFLCWAGIRTTHVGLQKWPRRRACGQCEKWS